MAFVIYMFGKRFGRWYVENVKNDFHTHYGVIPKDKLKPGKVKIQGTEFVIVPATFLDEYKAMKRKAQIITRKDVGFIIGYCGLTKDSVVVESGAGSGGSTIAFAKLCKNVTSYELNEEFLAVVKENLTKLKIKNATVHRTDFYDEKNVKKTDADVVLLDLPEPWRAYASAKKTCKLGGYVVAYTPSITQAQQFVNNLPKEFLHERTLELIDRDWKVQGQAVRPVSGDIGHTAFLTIVRRIL